MKRIFKSNTVILIVMVLLTLTAFAVSPDIGGAMSLATLVPVWGVVKDNTFKELSVDEIAKLSEEDQVKYFADKAEHQKESLRSEFKKMLEDANKGAITEEALKSKLKDFQAKLDDADKATKEAFNKSIKSIEEISKAQGLEITKLKDNGLNGEQKMTFGQAVSKALKNKHQELVDFTKNNAHGHGSFEIEIKAPAVITTVNIGPGGAANVYGAQTAETVSAYERGDIFVEQYLDVGTSDLATIPYVDEQPGEGDAAIVAEGSLKPLIDTDYVTAYSQARKIAGRMKATEEALSDYGWLLSAIENTLRKKHDIARQNDILGNTNGLESIATVFNASILGGVKVEEPQYYDAIAALIAGIANDSEGYYVPNVIFVNTLDNLKKMLTKDLNENYVMPPFADNQGNIIEGVRVVARPSISAGEFIVGDFKNVKLRNVWGYKVLFGWENDDFSKNQITMIGESRYHLYANTNDKRGIIKGTFADVITALTEV